MLREMATRYGRDNLGFFWLVGEPLIFCAGAFTLWVFIRPPYEHGVKLLPFVMTGYLPITLLRHMMNHAIDCLRANAGLIYHRRITILHLFTARLALEFVGVSMAFVVVFVVLNTFGQVPAPEKLSHAYAGWFLLGWLGFGLALILGSLATLYEVIGKFTLVLSYVMMPISGTFYMAAWLPPRFRNALLVLPFIHCNELLRDGFFGRETRTFYNIPYVIAWAVGLTFLGLLFMRFTRDRLEVE